MAKMNEYALQAVRYILAEKCEFALRFCNSKRMVTENDIDCPVTDLECCYVTSDYLIYFCDLKSAIACRNAIVFQYEMIGMKMPIDIVGIEIGSSLAKLNLIDWILIPDHIQLQHISAD